MKIINQKEFLKLPAGTLFLKYEDSGFDELQAKGCSWDNDFLCESITDSIDCTGSDDWGDKLEMAEKTGENLPMDFDSTFRDGLFDPNQLFAVYDKRDIEMLIDKLSRCFDMAYD